MAGEKQFSKEDLLDPEKTFELVADYIDQRLSLDLMNGVLKENAELTKALINQSTLMEAIFATLSEGLIVYDPSGKFLSCNPAAMSLLGLTKAQIEGSEPKDPEWALVDEASIPLPEDQHPVAATFKTGHTISQLVLGVDKKNMKRIWISCSTGFIRTRLSENIEGIVLTIADVSFSKVMENSLKIFNDKLTSILASLTDPVFVLDRHGFFVEYFYARGRENLFMKPEDFLSKKYSAAPLDDKTIEQIGRAISTLETGENEYEFDFSVSYRGQLVHYNAKTSAIRDASNNFEGAIIVTRDITGRVLNENRLKEDATTDALTHANNRKTILKAVDSEIKKSVRSGNAFSLIFFDIDHFKAVNDTYGHEEGDKVLVSAAECVREQIRGSDSLARWGGEEFLILLPGTAIGIAEKLAGRLRQNLASRMVSKVGYVTASFGVAQYHKGEDSASVISRADEAMYVSKKTGRNKVTVSRK